MKGLFASRHTSSERARPTAREHARRSRRVRARGASAGGRALRTGVRCLSSLGQHNHDSGPLTYLVMHLFELSRELSVRSDRRAVAFRERPSADDDQAPSSTPRAERITPRAATSP